MSFKEIITANDYSIQGKMKVNDLKDKLESVREYINISKLKKEELIETLTNIEKYKTKNDDKKFYFGDNMIELDENQYNFVVSKTDENKKIIAGAGSGKTTSILCRIKYLIDNYTTPNKILVLTFNVESAENLRDKAHKLFGFNIKLDIKTIDSYCCGLIYQKGLDIKNISLTEYAKMGYDIMKNDNTIGKRYKYIFFDEFQDVNDHQFGILYEFYKNGSYITVIGDDNQNIYQFRGTDVEYILNFDKIFKNSNTYKILKNYRSIKSIVDVSNKSIKNNKLRDDKDMESCNNIEKKPKLIIFDNEEELHEKINEIIDKNETKNNGDICILSRISHTLMDIETYLTSINVECSACFDDKEYDTKKKLDKNKVALMTIHKSKGLEFETVIIISLQHDIIPSMINGNIKNIEEERRLFYVAMTRAKKNVYFLTTKKELPLSRFLYEIKDDLDIETDIKDEVIMVKTKMNEYIKKEMFDKGNDDCDKEINEFAVMEIIKSIQQINYDYMRENNIIENIEPKIEKTYKNVFNYIKEIKICGYEADFGEYVDRYITRDIAIKNRDDYKDYDTEYILENQDKKEYKIPKQMEIQIKQSYNYLKNINNKNRMDDIYNMSLCRNFRNRRKRLAYKNITQVINEQLNQKIDEEIFLDRITNFSKNYNKTKIEIKKTLKHRFKPTPDDKEIILRGEIDMIEIDKDGKKYITDIKCSDGDFKIEWYIQLLMYYSLLKNQEKIEINYLKIVNIMTGCEYTIEINKDYDYKKMIRYIETMIINIKKSIRLKTFNYSNFVEEEKIEQENKGTEENKETKENKEKIITYNEKKRDNYMILDTETNGLSNNSDILSIAYIIVNDKNDIIKKVTRYIKGRFNNPMTYKINGIKQTELDNGIEFEEVIEELVKDIEICNTIIGHNIDFDIRKIMDNIEKYDIKIVNNRTGKKFDIKDTLNILCTKKMYKEHIKTIDMKENKLNLVDMYRYFYNKDYDGAHDAMNDVIATFECFVKLIE